MSDDAAKMPRMLWRHPDPKNSGLEALRVYINEKRGKNLQTFQDIHTYSVTELSNFYEDIWHHTGMIYHGELTGIIDENAPIETVPDWYPGARVNFTEMALFTRGHLSHSHATKIGKEDSKVAVTCAREGGTELYDITWGELRQRIGHFSQALRAHGVRKGDRVAAVVSNSAEAMVAFLSTVAIGAVYSSSATDMGTKGILDRMLQIEPAWIFMDDAAVYNGKHTDLRPKMREVVAGMAGVSCFRGAVALPRFLNAPVDVSSVPRTQTLASFLSKATSKELVFERVPFRYPFFIAYSSGTTGMPKCIVHCGGGSALNAKKEQMYHHRTDAASVYMQFTTTGWVMYLVQINCLVAGARVVLYDGSPFFPKPAAYINLMGSQRVTHLGTSPRYFQELQLKGISPRAMTDLSALKVVTSTGMVLPDALFHWFYDHGFPAHTQLSNITGGTDTNAAIANGNVFDPLYVGPCHNLNLGIAANVFTLTPTPSDGSRITGVPAPRGTPGELVITRPFPTMPVSFWGANGADQYRGSYFAKFDNAWTQGDFAMFPRQIAGLQMLGRADGVLNPSGVRFGSAELYSVIDTAFPTLIADSLAIGQRRPGRDSDESVILFLQLQPGVTLTRDLVNSVKAAIAKALSKRHVPRYVFETKAIPQTVNGKKVELPVKRIVCGETVVPSATLRNPECLKYYEQFRESENMWAEVVGGWEKGGRESKL
ncbi:acetoacetyl-CoA synthase [Geopyxis carbonaria]|nr:acetoacetyl-CoA synthase [Geopyxis carbonaria]